VKGETSVEKEGRRRNDVTAVFRRQSKGYRIAIDITGPRKEALKVAIGEAVFRLVFAASLGSNLDEFVPQVAYQPGLVDLVIPWQPALTERVTQD
jgi:hypothetical protein